MRPTYPDAINSLISKPTSFATDQGTVVAWDISEEKSGEPQPSQEAILTKLTRLQEEYDSQGYARKRRAAFRSESDGLFFQENAGEIPAGTHAEKRAEIKARFPK